MCLLSTNLMSLMENEKHSNCEMFITYLGFELQTVPHFPLLAVFTKMDFELSIRIIVWYKENDFKKLGKCFICQLLLLLPKEIFFLLKKW
uniref:Protein arginine N-methyltransferase n=1 Tax=Rhizophora mucronata TaxID=61149 RepID=A0A2P2MP18_RHIMU